MILQVREFPLIIPMDQQAVVKALQIDSKISKGLYNRLGEDVSVLKKNIRAEVSKRHSKWFFVE